MKSLWLQSFKQERGNSASDCTSPQATPTYSKPTQHGVKHRRDGIQGESTGQTSSSHLPNLAVGQQSSRPAKISRVDTHVVTTSSDHWTNDNETALRNNKSLDVMSSRSTTQAAVHLPRSQTATCTALLTSHADMASVGQNGKQINQGQYSDAAQSGQGQPPASSRLGMSSSQPTHQDEAHVQMQRQESNAYTQNKQMLDEMDILNFRMHCKLIKQYVYCVENGRMNSVDGIALDECLQVLEYSTHDLSKDQFVCPDKIDLAKQIAKLLLPLMDYISSFEAISGPSQGAEIPIKSEQVNIKNESHENSNVEQPQSIKLPMRSQSGTEVSLQNLSKQVAQKSVAQEVIKQQLVSIKSDPEKKGAHCKHEQWLANIRAQNPGPRPGMTFSDSVNEGLSGSDQQPSGKPRPRHDKSSRSQAAYQKPSSEVGGCAPSGNDTSGHTSRDVQQNIHQPAIAFATSADASGGLDSRDGTKQGTQRQVEPSAGKQVKIGQGWQSNQASNRQQGPSHGLKPDASLKALFTAQVPPGDSQVAGLAAVDTTARTQEHNADCSGNQAGSSRGVAEQHGGVNEGVGQAKRGVKGGFRQQQVKQNVKLKKQHDGLMVEGGAGNMGVKAGVAGRGQQHVGGSSTSQQATGTSSRTPQQAAKQHEKLIKSASQGEQKPRVTSKQVHKKDAGQGVVQSIGAKGGGAAQSRSESTPDTITIILRPHSYEQEYFRVCVRDITSLDDLLTMIDVQAEQKLPPATKRSIAYQDKSGDWLLYQKGREWQDLLVNMQMMVIESR